MNLKTTWYLNFIKNNLSFHTKHTSWINRFYMNNIVFIFNKLQFYEPFKQLIWHLSLHGGITALNYRVYCSAVQVQARITIIRGGGGNWRGGVTLLGNHPLNIKLGAPVEKFHPSKEIIDKLWCLKGRDNLVSRTTYLAVIITNLKIDRKTMNL